MRENEMVCLVRGYETMTFFIIEVLLVHKTCQKLRDLRCGTILNNYPECQMMLKSLVLYSAIVMVSLIMARRQSLSIINNIKHLIRRMKMIPHPYQKKLIFNNVQGIEKKDKTLAWCYFETNYGFGS
jgi:hypothetical protein